MRDIDQYLKYRIMYRANLHPTLIKSKYDPQHDQCLSLKAVFDIPYVDVFDVVGKHGIPSFQGRRSVLIPFRAIL